MREEVDKSGPDARIAVLAAAQHGVVSGQQLRAAGFSTSAVGRRVSSGRLHHVHRGVYAVGWARLLPRGRWWAAVLACGDGAVLSHASAAAAWELIGAGSATAHVTVPTGNERRVAGVRVHRAASLTPDDTTTLDGLPVTTLERTLLDLATTLAPDRLARVVEQAEAMRRLDHRRLAAPGRPGNARLRAALAEPATVTRSVLEDRFLALLDRHGLPRPLVNARVGPYEVDFLWPEQRLIVETDGWRHHGTRRAFREDRRRDRDLVAAGHRVIRLTHEDVTRDAEETARILATLLSAGAAARPGRRARARGAGRRRGGGRRAR
jgi:predicted transcriptional regulator of viral defense system